MKTIVDRASSRGYADHGWLQTHHTFSFADYYNPAKVHFGALRVLNDDTVAPGEGFGRHPHSNMEVVSIPLSGKMTHGDSIDNSSTITPGHVQLMSAGTGIYHSEFNESRTDKLEFLQIWVMPRTDNTEPKYENHYIRPLIRRNELSLFISPDSNISINQDAWFSMGELDAGVEKNYKLHGEGTGVYVFVIEGEVQISETTLGRRDGMGIWDSAEFTVKALENSSVLLIEIPMSQK